MIDMVYVENAAHAHLLAADALVDSASRPAGHAYFITQGKPVRCWRWIDELLEMAGLPPVDKSISFEAAYRIGALMEMGYKLLRLKGEPPMTRFLAGQLAMHHYFNITAARRDFGYEPIVSTEEGMRRLAAEYGRT